MRLVCLVAMLSCAQAQEVPRRILFLTHSAGYRHDSIAAARQSLETLDPERFEITSTEDLSFLTADRLKDFQAVFFFTSGELAIDEQQKADLLQFIRNGGGFAGAHSATDTLYTWPGYGELIGAYFDGHPWVGQTDIDIEDPDHPVNKDLGNTFRILDEIYKFRDFSRDRVRVLMTLRSSAGDRATNKPEYPLDSALAWCRSYGKGRVFYTALGHFDETWRDPRIRKMLLHMLAWLTGPGAGSGDDGDASAEPRQGKQPRIERIAEAAQQKFEGFAAPGAIVSIIGENLTSGSTMSAASGPATRLAGTWAWMDQRPVQIVYASPTRVDVLLPQDAPVDGSEGLLLASTSEDMQARVEIVWRAAVPGIHRVSITTDEIIVLASGIGPGTPLAEIEGVELDPLTFKIASPGVFELRYKRPVALTAGVRTLQIIAHGQQAALDFKIE